MISYSREQQQSSQSSNQMLLCYTTPSMHINSFPVVRFFEMPEEGFAPFNIERHRGAKTCFHYLLEGAETCPEKLRNPYIDHFRRQPWIPTVLECCNSHIGVRQLLNHKHLKKEITEMYGALMCMKRSLPLHSLEWDDQFVSFESLKELKSNFVIFDICSGKGVASFFLAFMFPEAIIKMIDKDKDLKLEHIRVHTNISYQHADIHDPLFAGSLKEEVEIYHAMGKTIFFMGLHLCGYLSIRMTEFYNEIRGIHSLVLSPCCMPSTRNKQKDIKEHRKFFYKLQASSIFNYDVWCLNVCFQIHQAAVSHMVMLDDKIVVSPSITSVRNIIRDIWVLTEKSIYIVASRKS
jgi:hypothetical protein